MESKSEEFFRRTIETPSPSGFEEPVQQLVRERVSSACESVRTDVHGNLIAAKNAGAEKRLMYAGHCDQIGMLISYVDELGFVYAQTIGGWDPQQLIGQAMTIWTDHGPVPAVISRKPIHLLKHKERSQVVELDQLWLDIGAADEEAAKKLVRVGDPVTLALGYTKLQGARVSGPGMDNKSGMWVVIEALVRSDRKKLNYAVHSVSTVQEEIGLRGAKTAAGSVNPDVAIAVDVTHATDCPTIDRQQQGDIKLGGGPVIFRGPNINRKVATRLIELAEANGIPYQLAAIGRATPNDANVLQVHGGGVATGLVAIPNRYMHSAVETVDLGDLDAAANLLARFAESLTAEDSFIPGG